MYATVYVSHPPVALIPCLLTMLNTAGKKTYLKLNLKRHLNTVPPSPMVYSAFKIFYAVNKHLVSIGALHNIQPA
eukprot:scaffold412612_cov19-Prasinocladus_malaysianus.AAC.1